MFVIQKEQMHAFDAAAWQRFEDEMAYAAKRIKPAKPNVHHIPRVFTED